ncbi:MAG: carboxypeptidase-like regulatory domain-containing protein, partial [Calditrichaeota bacterium]
MSPHRLPACYEKDKDDIMKLCEKVSRVTLLMSVLGALFYANNPLRAQQRAEASLSGMVTEETTRHPLPGVEVFLSHTALVATTNHRGEFEIKHVPLGTYELVVRITGYYMEHKTVRLDTPQNQTFNFMLAPETPETKDAPAKQKKSKGWQRNLERFEKLFLGDSENAASCRLLNPEILDFDYDKNTGAFAARAQGWLSIANRALGYGIALDLIRFTADANGRTDFFGFMHFTGLTPENEMEQKRWEERRLSVYKGSVRHFFAALAAHRLREEGFVIHKTERVKWRDLKAPNLAGVAAADISRPLSGFETRIAFQDYLMVTYQHATEEKRYVAFRQRQGSPVEQA